MLGFYSKKIFGLPILFFVFAFLVNAGTPVSAQTGQNPFELIPRLPKPAVPEKAAEEVYMPTGNPFDIIRGKVKPQPKVVENKPEPPVTVQPVEAEESEIIKTEDESYRQFLFVTLLTLFILLTLIFTIFRSVISISYRSFLNDNILNQIHRDQRSIASFPFQILYWLFFITAGTFTFVVLKHFEIELSKNNLTGLFMCIGGISVIFLAKHILLKIVGGIFPVSKEIGTYSFTIIIFNIILGIALIPFTIFIVYGTEELIPYAIYGALGVIAAFYIFRSLRGLFIGNRFLAYHKFHFLLYICTVEIAPLLILLKVLLSEGV